MAELGLAARKAGSGPAVTCVLPSLGPGRGQKACGPFLPGAPLLLLLHICCGAFLDFCSGQAGTGFVWPVLRLRGLAQHPEQRRCYCYLWDGCRMGQWAAVQMHRGGEPPTRGPWVEPLQTPGLTPSHGESESQSLEFQLQGSLTVALTFLIWKVRILTVPPSWGHWHSMVKV